MKKEVGDNEQLLQLEQVINELVGSDSEGPPPAMHAIRTHLIHRDRTRTLGEKRSSLIPFVLLQRIIH